MRITIKICLLVILLIACKSRTKNKEVLFDSRNQKEINIGKKSELKVSDLFSQINYVLLEKTNRSFIGEIDKVVIKGGKIFILDSKITKSLYIYNLNGVFLNKISQFGDYPKGYKSIVDFALDDRLDNIFILDERKQSLLQFDIKGHFISKKELKFRNSYMGVSSFEKIGKEFIFFNNNNCDEGTCYNIFITDEQLSPINRAFNIPSDFENVKNPEIKNLTFFNNKVSYLSYGNHFIYGYKKNRFFVDYHLNFQNLKSKDINVKDYQKLLERLANKNQTIGAESFFETNKYVYGTFLLGRKYMNSFFYNKKTHLNKWSNNVRNDSIGLFYPKIVGSKDNFLIGVFPAEQLYQIKSQLLKQSNKEKLQKIKDYLGEKLFNILKEANSNDNPIIVKYVFK